VRWDTLHYEQIMAALDRRLHILCEKPLACAVAHAKEIVERVRQTRRKLQIAYQRRTWPTIRYIREQMSSRALGRPEYISVVLTQAWLQSQKGTLVYEGGQIRKMTEPDRTWEPVEVGEHDDGLVARNWLDAIEGKAKLLSPARSAIGVTQITEATWNSAKKGGRPVRL
jgi:hypothetical protein